MDQPIVQIRGLLKRFGRVRAVDGIDLDVDRGEVFGLLGPNGAGKTTILRLLAGLIRPTGGTVRLFGLDPGPRHRETAARAGFLIESPGLHPNLSGRRNLDLFGRLRGLSGDRLHEAVEAGLALADLGSASERRASTYSTGMKQKTALALALLGDPELVVLDEPTSALDPASVVQLRDAIQRLREGGTTLLLSSHHLAEMETLCTRVAILRAGRVLASGVPADLRPPGPVRYRFRVGGAAPVVPALEALPGVRVLGADVDALDVELPAADVTAAVRAILEAGGEVGEIRPARSPLEEAYLHLTRPSPAPAAPHPGEGGGA